MRDLAYPLPYQLHQDLEMLLAKVPDRGDTVFQIRRAAGRIYAQGYADGRLVGSQEAHHDMRYEADREKADREKADARESGSPG